MKGTPRRNPEGIINVQAEFDALPQDRHFTFAAHHLILDIASRVARCGWGSGLMMTRYKTALIAARLRHGSGVFRECPFVS
jgi:hypothetical protein